MQLTARCQARSQDLPPIASPSKSTQRSLTRFNMFPQPTDALAHGVYVDSSWTRSNFGKLRIRTQRGNRHADDNTQAYAAGWLEGYMTAARMYDHHHNLHHYFVHQLNASLERPMQWLHLQEAWAAEQAHAHADEPYWQLLTLTTSQFEGLVSAVSTQHRVVGTAEGAGMAAWPQGVRRRHAIEDCTVGAAGSEALHCQLCTLGRGAYWRACAGALMQNAPRPVAAIPRLSHHPTPMHTPSGGWLPSACGAGA